VRFRYPSGIRSQLAANLSLRGTTAASTLTGRVTVDRLSFTQEFDLGSFIGQFSADIPSAAPVFEQNMKLDVAVASSESLNLTSSKLTIGGSFNLTVAGTLAEPVILGRVSLAQGEIFFIGKRYELESGTIEFANAVRTEPVLNIYATTTVDQYKVTVNFVGPLDRLITRYTSDPPLSQGDIIHLIAFGNTAEAAASAPSTPSSLAAESIVAQGVTSQISGKLENLTGISQISLDPLITNTVADPASQIAIQERVSGSLLLTFASDVTNTQAQTVEVQYKASKNVKVSIIRDYNGGYALDVRIHKAF
jgi:translocation and assembly module TamB